MATTTIFRHNKENYQPFEAVYGGPVSDTDQPSLKVGSDVEAVANDRLHKDLFVSAKVRDVIFCQECYKPRYVFSRGKLSSEEKLLLDKIKCSHLYTYGCVLLPLLLI